jgi:prepilin-type N-terminal cleavage/methylation domain-containing protein
VPGDCEHSSHLTASGYTLLEVLVVLVLLGMLLTGLAQGTSLSLLAFGEQSRLTERFADLDSVHRTLRQLIQNAAPGSEWEQSEFVGTAHSAAFTTVVPVANAASSVTRADVEVSVDSGHRLMLFWAAHLHAIRTGLPAAPLATLLLPGVTDFELSYWPTPGGGWTSAWHDAKPPRLVRIRITDGHETWPDLVATTMLDPQ